MDFLSGESMGQSIAAYDRFCAWWRRQFTGRKYLLCSEREVCARPSCDRVVCCFICTFTPSRDASVMFCSCFCWRKIVVVCRACPPVLGIFPSPPVFWSGRVGLRCAQCELVDICKHELCVPRSLGPLAEGGVFASTPPRCVEVRRESNSVWIDLGTPGS